MACEDVALRTVGQGAPESCYPSEVLLPRWKATPVAVRDGPGRLELGRPPLVVLMLNLSDSHRRKMRYRWGEVLARAVGGCWVGEDLKLWLRDEAFFREYRRLSPSSPRAAERVFAVRELVRSLSDVEGDTAECGVFQGTTSFFICQARGRGPHQCSTRLPASQHQAARTTRKTNPPRSGEREISLRPKTRRGATWLRFLS